MTINIYDQCPMYRKRLSEKMYIFYSSIKIDFYENPECSAENASSIVAVGSRTYILFLEDVLHNETADNNNNSSAMCTHAHTPT